MTATVVVHWPGKDTPACEIHAAKLVALGRVLGCAVSITPIFEIEECKNCENEKKKEENR